MNNRYVVQFVEGQSEFWATIEARNPVVACLEFLRQRPWLHADDIRSVVDESESSCVRERLAKGLESR